MGSFHLNLLHHQNGVGLHPQATLSKGNTVLGSLCALASAISYTSWLIINGTVVSGAMLVVISWVVHMRGPLFASVFNPLMLVMVALASCTMLNEKLYLGTIIGAVLIVCGLYTVVWGKSKEKKKNNQLVPSKSSNEIGTVEIVVRHVIEDKSNGEAQGNNTSQEEEGKDDLDDTVSVFSMRFCFEEKQNKCLLVVKMWNCDVQGRGGFCGPWARTRGFEPTSDWALLIAELGLELVKNKFKGNEKRGGEKF
ncbi:hypothetical protein TSUD_390200 [Trifolium subterraneum]|uniref:WAT1-related protein n=1 Tax=Trifolium subterraneum TaxID=3900 RepID=A0A2Z6P2I5_TRISU|nr:hypothetical protein TSUD_390200 [Trifolium subterraneum]